MNMKWFEKRGILLTIIYLNDVSKSNQQSISKAINVTNDTLRASIIPELEQQKLIKRETQTEFPYATSIELTEKGKKIATKLAETGIFEYP
jgi:DNA-binding HxlR family transcriptional regulator